jgi:hypothetical protein
MRTILILIVATLSLTSCYRWRIADKSNKYLEVLKRDGNLTKTKVRLANDISIDPITKDTMTSSVNNNKTWGGKATIKTTIRLGVTIPAGTKGKILQQDGEYFFVFKEREYRNKVGLLPLNTKTHTEGGKDIIFIRTYSPSQKEKFYIVGTKFKIDDNNPGFELKIKVEEETESLKAN